MIHEHEALVGDDSQHASLDPTKRHQHLRHYSLPLNTILAALGLPGDVRKAWAEDAADVLHVLVDDLETPAQPPGAYAEENWISLRTTTSGDSIVETISVNGRVTRTLEETRVPQAEMGR